MAKATAKVQAMLDKLAVRVVEIGREKAIEELPLDDYDFLVDNGVNLDELILTKAQIDVAKTVKNEGRPTFPNGYNKKYPKEKQDLYNGIAEYLGSIGSEITIAEKCNYRDLDFTLKGVKYKIVLSNPRT